MLKNLDIEKNIIDIYERKFLDCIIDSKEKWAIYGTGNGAEIVFELLKRRGLETVITEIIDNEDVVEKGKKLHGIVIKRIEDVLDSIDGIIIGSMVYHELIYDRVLRCLEKHNKNHIKVFNLFGHNTESEIREYVDYIEDSYYDKNKEFFKEFDNRGIELLPTDTKVIAWYLPQFYRIDINDLHYGRGFTEWTNTSKAIPMFTGHYQPHIPYDVGYYNLNDPEVFERQIYLAKHYGIYGFSFYFYWFSGKRIMEKPVEFFLNHPELDIHFCITWANENWSTLWDGGNKELIYEQKLMSGDEERFVEDIYPYMCDPRYISVNEKKLLIIYRATIWEKDKVNELLANIRKEAKRKGLGELYILLCNARDFDDEAKDWGADGLVEFPPHGVGKYSPVKRVEGYLNPNFWGQVRDTADFIAQKKYLCNHNSKIYYRGAMPSWDNTARKAYNGATIYTGLNPETFEQWITDIIMESHEIHSENDDIIFINAWNEWAEGAHLEPDRKYGYSNLAALKNALEKSRK